MANKKIKQSTEWFWLKYKGYIIGAAAIIIAVCFILTQYFSKEEYDLKVIYFTYTPVIYGQAELIEDYLESFTEDINSDGRVNVEVLNCSFSKDSSNTEYGKNMLALLQAVLTTDDEVFLFITDSDSIEYFDGLSYSEDFFEFESLPLSEEFYKATESEDLGALPEGLTISCKTLPTEAAEKNGIVKAAYTQAVRILETVKEK